MLLSLENIDAYQKLFGMNDRNMAVLEQELSVISALRGQELQFRGDAENVAAAETAVARLITLLQHGETIDPMRIRYVVSLVREGKSDLLDQLSGSDVIAITHRGRPIRSKTLGPRAYVEAVRKHELTLAVGPAGTGKTYLAMAMAVVALKAKEVERIVLTRPAVEAGEKLGFLPGDMTQKVDPYLRPLYDALQSLFPGAALRMENDANAACLAESRLVRTALRGVLAVDEREIALAVARAVGDGHLDVIARKGDRSCFR